MATTNICMTIVIIAYCQYNDHICNNLYTILQFTWYTIYTCVYIYIYIERERYRYTHYIIYYIIYIVIQFVQ